MEEYEELRKSLCNGAENIEHNYGLIRVNGENYNLYLNTSPFFDRNKSVELSESQMHCFKQLLPYLSGKVPFWDYPNCDTVIMFELDKKKFSSPSTPDIGSVKEIIDYMRFMSKYIKDGVYTRKFLSNKYHLKFLSKHLQLLNFLVDNDEYIVQDYNKLLIGMIDIDKVCSPAIIGGHIYSGRYKIDLDVDLSQISPYHDILKSSNGNELIFNMLCVAYLKDKDLLCTAIRNLSSHLTKVIFENLNCRSN